MTAYAEISLNENKRSKISSKRVLTPKKGIVNIDNITDEHYVLIEEIFSATLNEKIRWSDEGYIAKISNIILNQDPYVLFKGTYHKNKIELLNNYSGFLYIKIMKGFSKKILFETFIPSKPVFQFGKRIGSRREEYLYRLYTAVKFRVQGNH